MRRLWIFILVFLSLQSCSSVTFVTVAVPPTPPIMPIVELSSGITPLSKTYRIGILGVFDATDGPGAPLAAALSEQLPAYLTPIRRFEWFNAQKKFAEKSGGKLLPLAVRNSRDRIIFPADPRNPASERYVTACRVVDGVLIGHIVNYKFSGGSGTVEVEMRIINTAYEHDNVEDEFRSQLQNLVVLSFTQKVRFRMNPKQGIITLEKSDMEKLARQVQMDFVGKFDELSAENKLQIAEVSGRRFTFNAGTREQVKPGLVGYVVRVVGTDSYKYLAQFVVISVEESQSTAVVVSPENTLENIQPMSTIIFK
mgnify:CR=1 FL=1